eukprot:scaffold12001_cov116-Isochrysis_galbana.AAC.15
MRDLLGSPREDAPHTNGEKRRSLGIALRRCIGRPTCTRRHLGYPCTRLLRPFCSGLSPRQLCERDPVDGVEIPADGEPMQLAVRRGACGPAEDGRPLPLAQEGFPHAVLAAHMDQIQGQAAPPAAAGIGAGSGT